MRTEIVGRTVFFQYMGQELTTGRQWRNNGKVEEWEREKERRQERASEREKHFEMPVRFSY